jgi:hypothetical protein
MSDEFTEKVVSALTDALRVDGHQSRDVYRGLTLRLASAEGIFVHQLVDVPAVGHALAPLAPEARAVLRSAHAGRPSSRPPDRIRRTAARLILHSVETATLHRQA